MPPTPRRHRGRALAAAAAAATATLLTTLPALPALATDYTLSWQTINLATNPYTPDDTLHLTGVTFTSTLTAGRTLSPALDLLGSTTFANTGPLTLPGTLTGTGALIKSSTGSLTLAAPSPTFKGPVTLSAGTTTLLDPLALGPANAPTPVSLYGTIDVSAAIPVRPVSLWSETAALINNSATPVTVGPSFSLASSSTYLRFAGTGDITFDGTLPQFWSGYFYKSGPGTLTLSSSLTSARPFLTAVSEGTLRLGINAPFRNEGTFAVRSGATLDLNGFSSVGRPITLSDGATLANYHPTAISTLSTLPAVSDSYVRPTLAGNINLTAKVASLVKDGPGTLTLSAPHTSFTGSITINGGTVRLNAALPTANFAINNFGTATGALDLNGMVAPAGNYYVDGLIVNRNTAAAANVDFSKSKVTTSAPAVFFGGDGEIITDGWLPSVIYKLDNGTLTLPATEISYSTIRIYGGAARLRQTTFHGSLYLYGNSGGSSAFRAGVLDFNGLQPTQFISIYLSHNGGLVNNHPSMPVILNSTISPYYNYQAGPITAGVLGGDGTLHVATGFVSTFDNLTVNKIGAGLLTLNPWFTSRGFNLRAGTVEVEKASQLGSPTIPTTFLGGTLRIAPRHLPAQSSYTFPHPFVFDTPGGAIDTQHDTTLTGAFTGTGPLTKLGPATLTLTQSPNNIPLTLAAGHLRLAPDLPTPLSLPSLSLAPNTTLDLANNPLSLQLPPGAPHAHAGFFAQIRNYLLNSQLLSSLSTPTHSLGYLPTDTTLTIHLTPTGDANLDGLLNQDDYALLDRGLATGGQFWWDGDFNYDGQVDLNDYLLIDRTYLLTKAQGWQSLASSFLPMREAQFGPAYVSTLLTSIPEPSSLLLLTSAFCLLPSTFSRRRRNPR